MLLQIKDMKVRYGGVEALKGVSLEICRRADRYPDRGQWGGKNNFNQYRIGIECSPFGGNMVF